MSCVRCPASTDYDILDNDLASHRVGQASGNERDMIGTWCVTLRFGRDQITMHLTPGQMEDLCSEWQLEARKAESTDFGKRGAK